MKLVYEQVLLGHFRSNLLIRIGTLQTYVFANKCILDNNLTTEVILMNINIIEELPTNKFT
jgi:hypothetical protein